MPFSENGCGSVFPVELKPKPFYSGAIIAKAWISTSTSGSDFSSRRDPHIHGDLKMFNKTHDRNQAEDWIAAPVSIFWTGSVTKCMRKESHEG